MDNDLKVIKIAKAIYRKYRFWSKYRKYKVLSKEKGNDKIAEAISKKQPYMIGRGGAVELRCVEEYLHTGKFSAAIKEEIQVCAGFFPSTDKMLIEFCKYYMNCMAKADLLALWGVGAESEVIEKYCKQGEFTVLEALEPYYFDSPWSYYLKDKNVLIIHPFVDSIQTQYLKRNDLFENKKILPEFKSLSCVKAVQSNAGEITKYKSWFEALDYMKSEIRKVEFDVAIIGAGAYSLPLAAYVKELGKIAVQMSGSTQILFGIKGKRWENIPEVSRLFNDSWVKPQASETPKGNIKVEGGSYW